MQDRSLGNEFSNLFRRIQTLEEEIQSIRSQLATTHAGNRLVANTIIGITPPAPAGNGPPIQAFINNSGGALEEGDVVILDATGARLVNTTTTPEDILSVGAVRDLRSAGPFAALAETPILLLGNIPALKVTGAVAAGDYLAASATPTRAESVGATPVSGAFAIAETINASGDGTVAAFIFGLGGASGGTAYDTVEDEGTPLTQRTTMNFVGAGVTAADSGGVTTVTVPGSGTAYDTVEDEGTPLTQRTTMNFVGAGVTAADSGGVTTVTIPGDTGPTTLRFYIPFGSGEETFRP